MPDATALRPAPAEDGQRIGAARSPWRIAWQRMRRDRWAMAGGVVVLLFALVAIAAPLITALTGQDPYEYHVDLLDAESGGVPIGAFGGISAEHWFGVEPATGRDLFAIVVHGARTSLGIGVAATAVAVGVGTLVGLVAAYAGGWVDAVLSRTMDVLFGFPALIFMISLGVIAPPEFPRPLLLVLVIGLFGFPYFGRVIRGQAMAVMHREFIEAARSLGAGGVRIVVRELLPNVTAPVIVFSTLSIPTTIGAEAALSFLGVGVPPPTPDWGRTINAAIGWFQVDLAYLLFPGGALFLVVLAFNLFGDGLRDAFDPKSAR